MLSCLLLISLRSTRLWSQRRSVHLTFHIGHGVFCRDERVLPPAVACLLFIMLDARLSRLYEAQDVNGRDHLVIFSAHPGLPTRPGKFHSFEGIGDLYWVGGTRFFHRARKHFHHT